MEALIVIAVLTIVLALIFDFTNGFNDSASLVATMVASRAMRPRHAVILAGVFEFLGPVLGGTAVANTIGNILHADASGILVLVVLAAVTSAILWNLLTWYVGIPSSSSHAIVGGLVGAGLAASGQTEAVNWGFHDFDFRHPSGVLGVGLTLLVSPLLGFVAGFVLQRISMRLLRGARPRVNERLRRAQWVTSAALAFAHGTNDAQKTMGIITIVLLSGGWIDAFAVPLWVKFAAATMLAAGAMTGGWRIMRTVGRGIFRVRPVHALSSQLASAGIILGNAMVGGPVSTTHVVSSSIMGVGSATRSRAVRWSKVRDIVLTWVITIPATTLLSAVVLMILKWVLGDSGVVHE